MWGWASNPKRAKDVDSVIAIRKSLSLNEEYLNAFRTQSYVEFFTKAQQLVKEPSSSLQSNNNKMEILLEPEQNLIPSILESFSKKQQFSELKPVILRYFDTSAQASKMCTKLLTSINETQSNYRLVQRALQRFRHYSPESEQYNSAISELDSFSLLRNPLSDPNPDDFKLICDHFSSILQCLKSKREKVSRRVKLIEFIKKALGFFLTVACSVIALVAIGIVLHPVSGLLLGPALLGLSPIHLESMLSNLSYFKSRSLRKLREQLDVMAKGTYILNRDFDTMSRIVARLRDEVEHKKEMIRFCLDRKYDKFPLEEVVKELRKSGCGFKRQVEELEEHACLCLVTINKARVLVIKEISQP